MEDYVIDLSPLDKLLDLSRIQEPMRVEVEKAMQTAAGNIRKRMPDGATGNLRRAPTAIAVITRDGIEGTVYIPETNPAIKYASAVEYGRRPGTMPPWGPGSSLFKWVQRKVTSAEYQAGGKVAKVKKITRKNEAGELMHYDTHVRGAAGALTSIRNRSYLIARAIMKKGTKGQHPWELGWADSERRVQQIVDAGFANAMRS